LRKNIFNKIKETQINCYDEIAKIYNYFSVQKNEWLGTYPCSIENYINKESFFFQWKYRDTATSTHEFLETIGIINNNSINTDMDSMLCYFEFVVNMIYLLKKNIKYSFVRNTLQTINIIIDNIETILEKLNYSFEVNNGDFFVVEKDNKSMAISELYPELGEK